jgi:hypothetical protein
MYDGTTQTHEVDSLKHLIATTTEDTTKVLAMALLSFYTENVDTCLKIDYKALELARHIDFKKGEAKCLNQLGNDFWNAANYPKALDYYFQSLQINEELNNLDGVAANYSNIANIYSAQEDFQTALTYAYKALETRKKSSGAFLHVHYLILGTIYEKMDLPDSALTYYSRSYEMYHSVKDKYQLSSVLSGLGNVHARMGHPELALPYYRMSIAAAPAGGEDFAKSYYGLAMLFKQSGQTDSAFFYANKALAQSVLWPETHIKSAMLLSDLYEGKDNNQAFFYYKKAIQTRDSIYAAGKQLMIKNLSYNEQQRQQEIAAAQLKSRMERKQNLQYAAIAFAIIAFLIIFLLFSRSIIATERMISFFGVLGLLVVFEFINLLIHPWLASLTHESPVLLLLALVAIASLLIPLHHRLEQWIKEKMTEKNRKIRLAAAKKIIEKLENPPQNLQK